MRTNLRKLWELTTAKHRRLLLVQFCLDVLASFLEALSVGTLIPFVALLVNPGRMMDLPIVRRVYHYGFSLEYREFVLVSSLIVVVAFVIKNIVALGLDWLRRHISIIIVKDLSVALMGRYLRAPFTFHMHRNSVTLMGNINIQVGRIYDQMIQLLTIFSNGMTLLALLGLLLWLDALNFLVISISLGLSGIFFMRFTGRRQSELGAITYRSQVDKDICILHALGSIKETRILGRESFYLDDFERAFRRIADVQAHVEILAVSQRYFLEVVTVIVVLAVTLLDLHRGTRPETIVVKVSAFGVSAFRILPALVNLIRSVMSLRFGTESLNVVHSDLHDRHTETEDLNPSESLPFESSLELVDVSYRYPGTDPCVVRDINLTIPRNRSVGFVGATGVGKTTVIDIILGLLHPTAGDVRVDGQSIAGKERSWHRHLGYIPQDIYLADASIRANVAIGIHDDEIDDERVREALGKARLMDFVDTLPDGMETVIGERGIRVSGGQRQRIGIARAFYNRPALLVMDEATAALDNVTEREVLDSISDISGRTTLVIIAHRLTTVQNCDRIFFMEGGRITASGTYDELLSGCEGFRSLALGVKTAG